MAVDLDAAVRFSAGRIVNGGRVQDKIYFGPGITWGAVSQTEMHRLATDVRHELAYRVHYMALARANAIGHAEFGAGELRELLRNKAGEPTRDTTVSAAVRKARDLGLIQRESTVRCLVLSQHQFRRNDRASRSCRTHGIRPRRGTSMP